MQQHLLDEEGSDRANNACPRGAKETCRRELSAAFSFLVAFPPAIPYHEYPGRNYHDRNCKKPRLNYYRELWWRRRGIRTFLFAFTFFVNWKRQQNDDERYQNRDPSRRHNRA